MDIKQTACGILSLLLINNISFARERIDKFIPTKVIVADGYLQVHRPTSSSIEGCANTTNMVLPDGDKYFDAYLSIAMTSFISKKPLSVYLGAPCQHRVNWPKIITMGLVN